MKGRMFTLLSLVVPVSLLLAIGSGGAVPTAAQSQPAYLVAPVPARPAPAPVAVLAFGELPLSAMDRDNRLLISDNERGEHPDQHLDMCLVSDTLPVEGLSYVFEDFNDRIWYFNDFNGIWGEVISEHITRTFATSTYAGTWGASLRIDYDLPSGGFAGVWFSLWGHPDDQSQYLDCTDIYGNLNEEDKDIEQIHFWVRGSGTTTGTHRIKVELKDITRTRIAYCYIDMDDSDTAWREVVLDADVTNSTFWSYNSQQPDPTKIKELVFVVEEDRNNPTGTFYIDDIHFVDANDSPFDLNHHTDDAFLDFVSKKTFLYFLDWYDPNTGLFQDRSIHWDPDYFSTAATGFGLTALTIGESRGWISRRLAIEMITHTLQSLYAGQAPTDTIMDTLTGTNGYKGFYYHFLGEDSLRYDESELSVVDTAILMAGILTAREHFNDVPEIVSLADQIYGRVEWDWMLDPVRALFYGAWKPKCSSDYTTPAPGGGCFIDWHWDRYTDEVILISLLAIGSPTHPVPKDVFYAWERTQGTYGGYSLIHSLNGSFFTYVFAHLWVDFATLGEDNHPTQPVNWWDNSVKAAWANRHFVVDHQDGTACDGDDDYTTYGENSWGLTACEGPDGQYHAYGAPPAIWYDHDGTVASYGTGMAIMLLSEKAVPALKHYFANTDLWRYRFGFGDAYNLDPLDPPDCNMPWYNHVAFGIDQGPLLISLENYRSGLIWDTMKRNDHFCRALNSIWPTFLCVPISGPTVGAMNTTYTFTAVVKPTVTTPITYAWQATGQSPVTHTDSLSHTDVVTFTWSVTGTQSITVTATSNNDIGFDTHFITIRHKLYLPLVMKACSP